MGIPQFYRQWAGKIRGIILRNIVKIDTKRQKTNISSLCFDANSLIHEVAQTVFSYSSDSRVDPSIRKLKVDEKMDFFLDRLGEKITELIIAFNPDVVYFAVDGVAPVSKMQQQRKRRFMSYARIKNDKGRSLFDSNAITPGTAFMIKVDEYLQWLFSDNKWNDMKIDIQYSSHLEPGEGEQKIMNWYRDGYGGEKTVIYGLDADLILLSMVAPVPQIYMARFERGNEEYLDGTALKKHITSIMKGENPILDFILLITLIGNDFIPRPISADRNINEFINTMLVTYNELQLSLVHITDGRMLEINWPGLGKIVNRLSSKLEAINIRDSFANSSGGYFRHIVFADAKFNMEKFRSVWYMNSLSYNPYISGDMTSLLNSVDINLDEISQVTPAIIKQTTEEFIHGMEWSLNYFYGGDRNIDWFYYYDNHYAPLLSDIGIVCETYISANVLEFDANKHNIITPIIQLLSVLPRGSEKLLPLPLRSLISDQRSPISYLYPINAIVDMECKTETYKGTPRIPFVNIDRVIAAYENHKVSLNPRQLKIVDKWEI